MAKKVEVTLFTIEDLFLLIDSNVVNFIFIGNWSLKDHLRFFQVRDLKEENGLKEWIESVGLRI